MYILAIPGFFAPDFYLGFYYGKEKKNIGRVVSALFINRLIGLTTFILLASIALISMGASFFEELEIESGKLNMKLILLFISGILALLTLLCLFLKDKLLKIIRKIIQIWQETRKNKKKLLYAFFLKLGFNITGLVGRLAIGYLLGITIPIWQFACVILILNFLISLPISLNGVGVREAGYVGLFSLMGVAENTAFVFALCEFGITLFAALFGAIMFIGIKTKDFVMK
ncbi:MAG: flippase-like domain-containing protein, partial [Mariniphaga sp.]|nr:flippase-like domain-containing protein [Mariniphaga sp.]